MLIDGQPYRTVWLTDDRIVRIIDQRRLPWALKTLDLTTTAEVAQAISDMAVRGAGCIGATAAFGMMIAAREACRETQPLNALTQRADLLTTTRPTAVNLAWAIQRQLATLRSLPPDLWPDVARDQAQRIADEDAAACAAIGQHGLTLIQKLAAQKQPDEPFQILTHCNAGWLAFVDHGSATAPIYAAHDAGLPIHVWVDETRPRNQGARLTAWELAQHGVPHTLISDNAGGHLIQHGQVDLVITGADRVTSNGDVANKIGTYLKALAAHDNNVPFYVALPSSTLDWTLTDGLRQIQIEERSAAEVLWIDGPDAEGVQRQIRLCASPSPAANPAFDVTPARLVTGLITERGISQATTASIAATLA